MHRSYRRSSLKDNIGLGAVAAVLFIATILAFVGFVKVDAGEACVYRSFGEPKSVMNSGISWKNPIGQSVRCYTVRSVVYETLDEASSESRADYTDYAVDGVTRDGQPITVTFTLRYRVPEENLLSIHNTIGPDIDKVNERVVKFHSRTVVRQVVNSHTASELYLGGLDAVSTEVFEQLQPRFNESGVVLEYFEIKRPSFSQEYTDAIENKQLKKEEAEAATNEQEVARQQAETKKINAQAEADVKLIEAEGNANAIREEGKAYQEYPEVLKAKMIETLGNANLIVLPNDSIPVLDLNQDVATPTPGE